MSTTWAEREAELRARINDRYVDGDVIDDGLGGVAIKLDVAVETTYDLMTDGDNNIFFNRCPACECGCSGEANASDCACWCHHPDEGWKVWQERVQALTELVEAEIGNLLAEQVLATPGANTAGAAALRLRRALDAL